MTDIYNSTQNLTYYSNNSNTTTTVVPTNPVVVDHVIEDNDKGHALCEGYSFYCADFFNNVANLRGFIYIVFKLLFVIFVLFLSMKIPKDFLRRFTLYLFIPLFISHVSKFITFILYYVKHFHINQNSAANIMTAESIFDLISRTVATFVYYAFLSKSIVVYHGLFLAFLNPEKYEKWKSGFWFHTATVVPFVIIIAMNVPWGKIQDVEIYIKYSCRIVLAIIMIPLYLRTLLFLLWKKQQRDTIIDDRAIIRKAKSRLVWFTIYMTFMNIVNLFHFLESFFFIAFYIDAKNLNNNQVFRDIANFVFTAAAICDEARSVALVFCTLLFIPIYREAIFLCRKKQIVFKSAVLDLNNS